jgi:hypothetical protein
MHLLSTVASWEDELSTEGGFPAEVQFVLSALDAVPEAIQERRTLQRAEYRVKAMLRLFSDAPDAPPLRLYVRNISERAMGFICPERLPLGYGGLVLLPAPDGRILHVHCTTLRCREATPGWYDGAVYFNRPQVDFRMPG